MFVFFYSSTRHTHKHSRTHTFILPYWCIWQQKWKNCIQFVFIFTRCLFVPFTVRIRYGGYRTVAVGPTTAFISMFIKNLIPNHSLSNWMCVQYENCIEKALPRYDYIIGCYLVLSLIYHSNRSYSTNVHFSSAGKTHILSTAFD